MGLFEKIKGVFYDEEIIDVPAEEEKREVSPKIEKVVTTQPVKEEKVVEPTVSVYSEREIFKTEPNTFKFPVIDEEEEKPKQRTRMNAYEESIHKRENKFNDLFKEKDKTPEKKPERVFKPSPVISPVYGVLDKNYTKEEIMERGKETPSITRTATKDMNYDSVRRKAYGTLEDELENTLTQFNEPEITKDIDETDAKSIEDLLNEIECNKSMSIGEIEEKIKDKMEEEETIVKEEKKENLENTKIDYDKTLEHDLFNLIDSMYEEKEGE